ncbi:CpaF family protein [Halobacteriovorax vibrionivorans]|uniref:CpaF family protein n=1 Tax=Halobacteriovorax vibrionivorans TaxID=2152716 RepID=A0ABY0IEJ7_9BACT|nr:MULTISPECIES: ATPase, T2SS/T4P/T4SS family [Halobacteriovorax]RZF21371.1 CpaF family protein [Halobacteriovorax vibrionivorans]TGD46152.1 CpaF family protein [Halobacteriovorax sp. Y22]
MEDLNQFFFNEFRALLIEKSKKSNLLSFDLIVEEALSINNLRLSDLDNIDQIKIWFEHVYNQSYIDDLLKMYDAREFIIHSPSDIEVHAKTNEKLKVEFLSNEDFQLSLTFLTRKLNIEWSFSSPFASFKVSRIITEKPIDMRISLTHPCLSPVKQAKAFIRVHSKEVFNLDNFTQDNQVKSHIYKLVNEYKNIVIAGSTGSGKTSFLKVCKDMANSNEHHVIIEDVAEIDGDISNTTHLLSHSSSGKSLNDYCTYALRMSPKRIFLGEIRSEEIVPFLLAMNTGHKGMMTTIHANNAKDTLLRLSTLFSIFSSSKNGIEFNQVLKLICQCVDNVVFVENKEVTEIIEVYGSEGDNPIYSTIYEKKKDDHQKGLSTPPNLAV